VSEHQSKRKHQKQATQNLSNPNLGDTTANHRIIPTIASSQPVNEMQAKPQEENPSTNSQETEASQPTCYGHDISRISLRPTQRIFASGTEIFNQHNEVVIPPIPKSGGEPLQPEDRAVFEQSMELPLNRVRIHTSDEADNAARQMGAEAFTLGSDIYFANGFYAPGTPLGDRILGHELTHVKQNSDGKILSSSDEDAISKPTDPLEQEAYAQENIIANDVRKLRGDETSPAPIPSSNPPTSSPEKTGSEKNLASPSSSAQDNEEEKLIPQLPEAPSPFAVTNIEQQQSITPASPTSIPAPNDYATPATTVEPPKPNQAVIENTATTQQTNISTNQMEVQTPPTMTSATLPVADTVTQQLPRQLEVVTETPPAPANLGVDIPLALEETSNDTNTALDTPDDVNLNEDGTSFAITQADEITQESQAMAQEVALFGAKTLDSITIQISELAASIQIKAEQARSEVVSAYTTQQEAVQAKVAETVAAIASSQKQNHTAISNFADAQKQRFYTTKQTQREGAVAFIQEQKQQTIAAGDTQAQRALNQSEEKASSILAEAASVKTDGEPPSVEAQQKALQQIAENTAQKCRQTGNDLGQRVRLEATQQAGRYDELLQNYLQQLDTTGINIESSLSQFIDAARSRTDTIAQQATTAAQEMGSQSVATLETEKKNALTQIQTWVEQTSSVTQQLGSQLQEPFTNQISSLQESLINYGANAAAQLRTMERPELSQVEAATAQMRQNMQEAYNGAIAALNEYNSNTQAELAGQSENLNSQLSELVSERITSAQQIGSQMVQALLEGAQNATTGMESATVSFQEKLTSSVNQAIADLTNVDQQFRSQVETTHTEAISALSQIVDDGLKSEDNLIADARKEMSATVGQIAGKYEQLKTEAESRSAAEGNTPATRIHRGIWGSITSFFGNLVDKVKKWFADTFGEFWGGLLFGILAGLVIVAVGWLAMTGLGALLVAIGVSAKVAAIVVVVVGLVIAIPLGIYNRFQEFYADNPGEDAGFWRGLGLVALGILDLTGIPFIIEGLVGQRAFGKELKGFERWERLGMGLVFLGGFLVTAKNLLRDKPKPSIEGEETVPKPGKKDPVEPGKDPVEPVKDPVEPAIRAKKLFNRAKEINKRADNLAKKFGKKSDPELNKIQETNDEILTKAHEAEPSKLDTFERTLDENGKKLDELEKKFAEEINVKIETLKDAARRQKNRAYQAADETGGGDSSELIQIATDAELIERELKQGTPEPKTVKEYEYTLEKNNRSLREIEEKLGIASFEYVEEFELGKYKLKPEYVENWRKLFYECRYTDKTYAEIERLRADPRSKGGWAHQSDPNLIWDEVKGKFVDATENGNTITVDHNPEAVVDHWNSMGNNMGQDGRHDFFRDESNHKIVLKKYNSSEGGKKSGQFNPKVGSNFSGPRGKK
jgi:hypothetical protein